MMKLHSILLAWLVAPTAAGVAAQNEPSGKPLARQGIEVFHLDSQQRGTFLDAEAARFGDPLKHSRVVGSAQ